MRPRTLDEFVGPGAPARRGLGAAPRDRAGPPALDDPPRAARDRQDDARADRRRRRRTPRSRSRARSQAGRAEVRAVIERARERLRERRAPDDLLPRRDPPLQQGPAGRAAARGRGGAGHADRRDDREPVLRGQLGAALAHAASTSSRRSTAEQIRELLDRAVAARRLRAGHDVDDEALEFLARAHGRRRAHGAQRARARLRGGRSADSAVTLAHAEDALQRRALLYDSQATATTTRSRPGSRRRAAPIPTPRSTTWR